VLVKLGHVVICSVDTACFADGHYVDPTPRLGATYEAEGAYLVTQYGKL